MINDPKAFVTALETRAITNAVNLSAEQQWDKMNNIMKKTYKETQKQNQRSSNKKPRLSEETMKLINNRREMKENGQHDADITKLINRQISKSCRKDKNTYINNICKEIQSHAKNVEPKDLYKKGKLLSRDFQTRNWMIEDEKGIIRTEKNEVAEVWRNYCRTLYYHDERTPATSQPRTELELEQDILKSEVIEAILII